jgi:hypothetical protein
MLRPARILGMMLPIRRPAQILGSMLPIRAGRPNKTTVFSALQFRHRDRPIEMHVECGGLPPLFADRACPGVLQPSSTKGSVIPRNPSASPRRSQSPRAYNSHMGIIQAPPAFRARYCSALVVLATVLFVAGCHSIPPLDTKPLDTAGMNYDAIHQLTALNITAPEVAQLVTARQAGFSDANCIAAVQIYRGRSQPFDGGDEIASLIRAQVGEDTILELARLNQLGVGAGELEAMRLAGLPDAILLEVARQRAAGRPVLAGASLANLKNAGVRELTLLELVRRGVPDSQAAAIIAFRRHGATDAQIISHFAAL